MTETEGQLIDRARSGDLGAFNRLVEEHQAGVYNLCLRLLASPQSAEDATQEAFISAYRAVGRFRGQSFRAWLYRIAANACYDELRRSRARPARSLEGTPTEDLSALEPPDPDPGPAERIESQELVEQLQAVLNQLPLDQRTVIVLRDVQGLSYEEIAEATGASPGTVKSRIARARERARSILLRNQELLPPQFRQ
jgi:RNA polymerase sigma-70 factor (ECF subfamily)